MTALAVENSISYGEPPVYSSRDFVEVQRVFTPQYPDYWYKSGSSVRIAVNNLSQNEFIDTTKVLLECGLVSVIKASGAGTAPNSNLTYPMTTAPDILSCFPGIPNFGPSFIGRCTVTVPGLALDQHLTSDQDSQVIAATRLMCSSGTGEFDDQLGPLDFHIAGKPALAGARSVVDRMKGVFCGGVYVDALQVNTTITGTDAATTKGDLISFRGRVIDYQIPLSMLSPSLAQGASCRLPLAYLASGGDLMAVDIQLAPASSTLSNPITAAPQLSGDADYWVVTPRISMSVLQINSPAILTAIEALYRGVSSVPIAPGIDAASVMVYKTVEYAVAYTDVTTSTGAFQLPIPANQPSCRGVMLKFVPNGYTSTGLRDTITGTATWEKKYDGSTAAAGKYNGRYAFGIRPLLDTLQLRIGSFRVPLDPMSDIRLTGTTPPGLKDSPFDGLEGFDKTSWPVDNYISVRHQARLYNQVKHLFSPFAVEEDVHDDALWKFWAGGSGLPYDNGVGHLITGYTSLPPAFVANPTLEGVKTGLSLTKTICGFKDYTLSSAYMADPCMYAFPFETASSVYNHRADAFACRGMDLRNITNIQISGRITGVDTMNPPGASLPTDGATPPVVQYTPVSVTSWRVYAIMAYDVMKVILPGRVDTAAQFSLLPAGATSLSSGGNPSA